MIPVSRMELPSIWCVPPRRHVLMASCRAGPWKVQLVAFRIPLALGEAGQFSQAEQIGRRGEPLQHGPLALAIRAGGSAPNTADDVQQSDKPLQPRAANYAQDGQAELRPAKPEARPETRHRQKPDCPVRPQYARSPGVAPATDPREACFPQVPESARPRSESTGPIESATQLTSGKTRSRHRRGPSRFRPAGCVVQSPDPSIPI